MKFNVTFYSAILLAGSSVAGSEVTGFHEYKFGMKYEELNNMLTLSASEISEGYDEEYKSEEKIEVLGNDYEMSFGFKNEKLSRINLSRMGYDANEMACVSDFDDVFAAIQANYGSPDSPPDKEDPEVMSAKFTAKDGSAVSVYGLSFSLINNCNIIVAYTEPKSGANF